MAPERSSANWATRWMAGHEVFGADDDELVVVAGEDGFVVGELAGELAAGEDAAGDAEEEGLVVVAELEGGGVGGGEQAGELGEGLAGDEGLLFAGDAFEGFAEFFDVGEAVAVGGDHGHGLGLEDEEGAVEGVAGLFVGDGEDGFRDHVGERGGGDFVGAGGGEFGDLGEVGAGHADHLGVGAAGLDLDPVVVHELERDVAVAEELDVVVELAGGDGAGAGLLDLGGAGGAEGLVEVGGGDGEAAGAELVDGGFEEEVREDGDGGLALDDGLRGGELAEEFGAGDGDLEIASGDGFGGDGGGRHDGGSPLLLRCGRLLCRCEGGGGHAWVSPRNSLGATP